MLSSDDTVRLKFFSTISISLTHILLIYLFNRITSEFDNYSRSTHDIFQIDFSISRPILRVLIVKIYIVVR